MHRAFIHSYSCRARHCAVAAVLMFALLFAAPPQLNAAAFTLDSVQQDILTDNPTIPQMDRRQLLKLRQDEEPLLLFDVREKDEFAVSHLENAIRLDPATWKSQFAANWAKKLRGKTVVFYCSVGVRSTKMAAYLAPYLKQQGASAVYNLQEGIFGWANAGKPMVNKKGPTSFVHPFDDHWGQLLNSRDLWRKTPAPE